MIKLFECIVTDKAKTLVNQVLDNKELNQGRVIDLFEETLYQDWGLTHPPITLNSCTFSLFLALKLAGVQPNDEVLLPAQTFISTGLAVLMIGAKPIFVDIDNNGNLSLDSLKQKYSKNTKAIIAVHWGGFPCDIKSIYEYCSVLGIKVIEDAAHAFGTKYRDSTIGDCKYSDFCCFSLQSIKALTSGDGGILCCRFPSDRNLAQKLRWFGMDKKNIQRGPNGNRVGDVDMLGYKAHMNDFSGALGLGNLDGLKERLDNKFTKAMRYNTELFGFDGITLPSANYPCKPNYWLYTIKAERRNDLIKKLVENDVQASTVDTRIDNNTIFSGPKLQFKTHLPNQNWFEENQLSIPCTYTMTDEDQTKIISLIKEGW